MSQPRAAAPARRDFAIAAAIVALAGLAVLLVDPRGDFPLNDDWAYAFSTRRFLETGAIERLRWTWAPIVTHVWVGAAASALAGFSFETLRATTLVLGAGAVLAAYGLARGAGLSPERSALCAAALGVCPVFFNLCFTFMTDVPFAFWTLASLAVLARGLRARGGRAIAASAAGLALCGAATALRQPGAAVAIAFAVALVATRIRTARQLAGLALGAAGAALALLVASSLLFGSGDGGGTMLRYLARRVLANPNLPYFLACNGMIALAYTGAFLAPVAPFVAPPRGARALAAASVAAGALVPLALARLSFGAPPGVNLVWNAGLGARTLDGLEALPATSAAPWWAAVAIGAACGAWTLGATALAAVARMRALRSQPVPWLLLAFPLVYLAPLALRFPFFDRYLGVAIAPLAIAALGIAGRERVGPAGRAATAAALAILAAYSLLGTRDYMERHRARQVLLDALAADGVSPRRIDGGFEHAGWHNFDRDDSLFLRNERRWVVDDEWLVTYAPARPGHALVRGVEYRRWLPPGRESIQLLVREPGAREPLAPATAGEVGATSAVRGRSPRPSERR
ncbi:MAG: hypothetical protein R3E88_16765 [Myxococcota bacterium]